MRYFILSFCVLLTLSCKIKQKPQQPTWLIGKWERVNEKANKRTFDFWNKDLIGVGFTLRENDTVFKELMSIITLNDTLHLKVEGVNDTPTLFKFIQQTDTSFVCENPENEFPKQIYYYKDGKQLKCKISNKEFSVDFVFNKIN